MPTSSNCVAYRDQAGDYVCDRCGTRWDADDKAPECLPWGVEHKADRQYGCKALKHIREGLEK